MFVKVTPRKKGGKTYYYAELVESYKEDGRSKHKQLMYFGSVDLDTANRLKLAFSKDFESFTNIDKVSYSSAIPYGNFYLIDALASQLELFDSLKNDFKSSDTHITVNTAIDYLKTIIFQRIIQPDSKLALVDSYNLTPLNHFVSLPESLDLQTLYRSLEVLEDNFPLVEKHLYRLALEEFNQSNQELFYDITSSYFEGHKCIIAEYGYSRDKRSDKEQLVIGLVTTSEGFPIKCNIYPGNKLDKTTVVEVVAQIKENYPIEEIVFVGDRGMLTSKNVEEIEKLQQKYVMAIPRTWTKKYLKGLIIDEKTMTEVKENLYTTRLSIDKENQYLLCLNTDKRDEDHSYRSDRIDRIKLELANLNQSIAKGTHVKTRDEAMKKAGAISKMNTAGKYFIIETVDSDTNKLGFELKYEVNQTKLESDQKLDGTFVIQTNKDGYSDEKLIEIYKNLSKVENAFKIIKNDLDMRPMYHWKESRVKGHIYACVISYFLINAIEYISKKKGLNKSARKILRSLSKINIIDVNLPDGKRKHSITTVDTENKKILEKFKVKRIEVPKQM